MQDVFHKLTPVLPEITMLVMTVASLLAAIYAPPSKAKARADKCVYAGLLAAFAFLCLIDVPEQGLVIENPSFVLDGYAVFLKKLVLPAAFICMLFGTEWLKYKKYTRFEFAPLLGFSVTGMMLTVSARTFLMQFLGLEMMHFPLLFLAAYKRSGDRSTEAGAKYAVTFFLSSGLYLFGVSVIYACLGTMDFLKIMAADKTEIMPVLLWGLSFITTGLLLKIGAAPFHFWTADVYECAPSPVTAILATIVRLSVVGAFSRVVLEPFSELTFYWRPVLTVVCALSVIIGGSGAIIQTNIKRLAAYTAIVLNGFALASLVVEDVPLLLKNVTVDLVLMLGFVAIFLSLRIGDELAEQIRVLSGQGLVKPVRGGLFSLIFLGLSGAPPFAGFWSRFLLFQDVTRLGKLLFAFLMMSGGLLIMYVYLRLIRQMYGTAAKEELSLAPLPMKTVIILSAIFSVFFFVLAYPVNVFPEIK